MKKELLNKAIDVILDVCFQYADFDVEEDYYVFYSYGLSTLENCFEFLIDAGVAEGDNLRIKVKKELINKNEETTPS